MSHTSAHRVRMCSPTVFFCHENLFADIVNMEKQTKPEVPLPATQQVQLPFGDIIRFPFIECTVCRPEWLSRMPVDVR